MPVAILTLILSVAFAISPFFFDSFTGYRPDQLPIPQPEPPIQPSRYAFSIWTVIYAWLIVSAAYGVWQRAGDPGWMRVRWPLMISLALGTIWIGVANTDPIWSTITIFVMLATALAALWQTPEADRWWLRVPVALFAGWLTAASFVSLGVTAAGYGVVFGAVGWAVAGILMALAVALVTLRANPGAPEYAISVVWALIAIAVRNGTDLLGITLLALAGAVVVAGVAIRGRRAV